MDDSENNINPIKQKFNKINENINDIEILLIYYLQP